MKIMISAVVDTVEQAHAVLANLHHLSIQKCFKDLSVFYNDSTADTMVIPRRQISEEHLDKIMHEEPDQVEQRKEVNYQTTQSADRANIAPPTPPTTRLFTSVQARVMLKVNAGLQPHKDDLPAASAMWARGEIKFDGDKYYL